MADPRGAVVGFCDAHDRNSRAALRIFGGSLATRAAAGSGEGGGEGVRGSRGSSRRQCAGRAVSLLKNTGGRAAIAVGVPVTTMEGLAMAAAGISKASRVKTSRVKVQEHRARLHEQGLRAIRIWMPDVRSPAFRAAAHRQSLAVAASPQAVGDQAFHRRPCPTGPRIETHVEARRYLAGGRDYAGKPRPVVIVQDDSFDMNGLHHHLRLYHRHDRRPAVSPRRRTETSALGFVPHPGWWWTRSPRLRSPRSASGSGAWTTRNVVRPEPGDEVFLGLAAGAEGTGRSEKEREKKKKLCKGEK